jgi:hypothetical protein
VNESGAARGPAVGTAQASGDAHSPGASEADESAKTPGVAVTGSAARRKTDVTRPKPSEKACTAPGIPRGSASSLGSSRSLDRAERRPLFFGG